MISIVWALHSKLPDEIWEIDKIHAYGFNMDVVEFVNVHDDIKIGLPSRDARIENDKQRIRNLNKFDIYSQLIPILCKIITSQKRGVEEMGKLLYTIAT